MAASLMPAGQSLFAISETERLPHHHLHAKVAGIALCSVDADNDALGHGANADARIEFHGGVERGQVPVRSHPSCLSKGHPLATTISRDTSGATPYSPRKGSTRESSGTPRSSKWPPGRGTGRGVGTHAPEPAQGRPCPCGCPLNNLLTIVLRRKVVPRRGISGPEVKGKHSLPESSRRARGKSTWRTQNQQHCTWSYCQTTPSPRCNAHGHNSPRRGSGESRYCHGRPRNRPRSLTGRGGRTWSVPPGAARRGGRRDTSSRW